jgi:hypothetical protein
VIHRDLPPLWVVVTVSAGAAWPSSESDAFILPHLLQDAPTEETTPDHCGCSTFCLWSRRIPHKASVWCNGHGLIIVSCDYRPQPLNILITLSLFRGIGLFSSRPPGCRNRLWPTFPQGWQYCVSLFKIPKLLGRCSAWQRTRQLRDNSR